MRALPTTSPSLRAALAALAVTLASPFVGCTDAPEGLFPAPPRTAGPTIAFDLLAKPLPEIPFPNDLATRLDPDSPTGRRINAALVAPTLLENDVREEFALLDGFGTFAPITVSFDAEIDPLDVRARHLDDDFANDAVYLVNLRTGAPVPVDLGRGNFPIVVQNNDKYFLGDPRDQSSNLLFESYDEPDLDGDGVLDPEEDTDGDGHRDRPNTANPEAPAFGIAASSKEMPDKAPPGAGGNDRYRDLLTFYERETHTLIIRPVVPLEQRTTYAVVLTRRIRDAAGHAINPPFPFVNHAAQTDQLAPLLGQLGRGNLAGLTRDDVAFTWAFTTQSVTTDLEAIRAGLYGEGPLGWLSAKVDAKLEPVMFIDPNDAVPEPKSHPVHPLRDSRAAVGKNLHTVPMAEFRAAFDELTGIAFGISEGPDKDALLESYKFVDYLVIGSFKTANFLDDPQRPTFDAVFRINAEAGTARLWQRPDGWESVEETALITSATSPTSAEAAEWRQRLQRATRDRVTFMLAVPKSRGGVKAPFPVAIYGHGYTSNRPEMLGFAGNMAKFGIATVAIDSYGHGLDLSAAERATLTGIINRYGYGPLAEALFVGRARDLDNDQIGNSGGDFWVADTFHTRDVVRQSVVDWMQLVRVFHTFGSTTMGDVNGDGRPDLSGDFNGDGVIDVGGPATIDGAKNPGHDFFVWGQSLGGILAGILPAVEPGIVAAAPVAGGGGLADIGIRSEQGGVIQAVFLEILGPILAGVPRDDGRVDLIYEVQDVNDARRVRLATFEKGELLPGDVIEAVNLNTDGGEPQKKDRAVAGKDGRFRLQVAADSASFRDGAPVSDGPVRLGACDPELPSTRAFFGDALIQPADCIRIVRHRAGAPDRVVDTFEKDVTFQGRSFAKGTPLVALARGFGMKRGTPTFRRFMTLAQTILEAGDPVNYANHYATNLLTARAGNPAAVLVIGTTGDLNVPVNTAYTQARAAGALPYIFDSEKHAAWGMSPNDVLIASKATECIEKLRYFTPIANRMRSPDAVLSSADERLAGLVSCERPEDCERAVLVDPGGYAFDGTRWLDVGNTLDSRDVQNGGVPRMKVPLRDAVQVKERTAGGDLRITALVTPYLEETGTHGFGTPNPVDPFDVDLFMVNLIGRFFQSRGADLRFDTCMHRDGYDRPRLKPEHPSGTAPIVDAEAVRVPACDFIPETPGSW